MGVKMEPLWGLGWLVFVLSAIVGAWDWGRTNGEESQVFKFALGGIFLGIVLLGISG